MAPRARSPTSLRVDGGRRCGSALGRVGGDEFSVFAPLGPRCTASIGVASAPRDAKTLHDLRLKADLALHAAKEQGGNTGLTPSDEMVLSPRTTGGPSSHVSRRLRSASGRKEAILLREALDDLLRKYDRV